MAEGESMFSIYIKRIEKILEDATQELETGHLQYAKAYFALAYNQLQLSENYRNELVSKRCSKQLGRAFEIYARLQVKIFFAETYSLLDKYNKSLDQGNLEKARSIHAAIKKVMVGMYEIYNRAYESGLGSTTVYSNFPQNYEYLNENLEKCVERYYLVKARLTRNVDFVANRLEETLSRFRTEGLARFGHFAVENQYEEETPITDTAYTY